MIQRTSHYTPSFFTRPKQLASVKLLSHYSKRNPHPKLVSLVFVFLSICIFTSAVSAARRVGIYLGTFDPPHCGHIRVALEAQSRLKLDYIYMIPNYSPRHKPGATAFSARFEMIRLVSRQYAAIRTLSLSDFEHAWETNPGDVYEPLIAKIKALHGCSTMYYQIIGADAIPRLIKSGHLPVPGENRTIVVFERKGYVASFSPALHEIMERGQLIINDPDIPDISSTKIRATFATGLVPPAEELPDYISAYIINKHCYGYKNDISSLTIPIR
ncbi:MAG: nicotinate-nicotinamide nucleotide adenylyltransferase [Candidatus Riflebacteria bacterium]|nr:nicotinate-nicotinamide nucleotide adenylyltransferase [Candidatus Riflebacteria bacterium]